MASSPTELYLPHTLPYPIKITTIDVPNGSDIQRGTRLLSYSFAYIPPGDAKPEQRFGTWEAALEGTVNAWKVVSGEVISAKKARDRPALVVIEPCKHGMQLGGLCVLCGKDMTNTDYTGFSDASRASIQMTHSAHGPTVSLEEAQRIERETADHLLRTRKLSLIVDLDQTIVHATVDPTVGEWINEGEAWEARQAKKAAAPPDAPPPPTAPDGGDDDDDECNPNWEALKDVKRFRLGPESFAPASLRDAHRGKGKNKAVETEGCMYYIKPRPGWKEFLRDTATKYEMHVYTMGTRAYAEEVCKAIDPDGSIFGGRVLSRDESGSLTQKSLQRLFPCDTSMVVIIDDRADVWEWSPNLLKVIPYDFFIGIGDINSTFLPKIEPLTPVLPEPSSLTKPVGGINESTTSPAAAEGANPAALDTTPLTPLQEGEAETEKTVMVSKNNAALDAQLEERPLAKKEKELQEHENPAQNAAEQPSQETVPSNKEPSPKPEKMHKKALLKNDDYELDRIGKLLNEVHSRFFSAYDARLPQTGRKRPGKLSKPYDVTNIIPRLRSEVFEGVHILFSSVIPLDTRPESTEIWRTAHMFGARCSTELTSDITHVVAAKRGTVKVDTARKRGGIKIVWLAWFTDSVSLWRRQDETPYLLDDPPMPGPSTSPAADQLVSSDIDLDSDDWDQDPAEQPHKDIAALDFAAVDWDEINNEVDAFMNESDDEDEDGDGGQHSGDVSEDDWASENGSSANSTPLKRKRGRSTTPSENGGANGDEHLSSPLAKRKKLAADRSGYSKLKEGVTADEVGGDDTASTGSGPSSPAVPPVPETAEEGANGVAVEEEEEEETEWEEDEEDDFLAREMEEELG